MIRVNKEGMELAIKDALKEMEEDGSDGFSYPIGEINGVTVRLVMEPIGGVFDITYIESGMTYTVIYEEKCDDEKTG